MFIRNPVAEEKLLALSARQPMVNIAELARGLGCSPGTAGWMVKTLKARGHQFAPRRLKKGRTIELKCSGCGRVRRKVPSRALQRVSDLCRPCWLRSFADHRGQAVVCRSCGQERRMKKSLADKLKTGLCQSCWFESRRVRAEEKRGGCDEDPR